jgi:hypothetical protein
MPLYLNQKYTCRHANPSATTISATKVNGHNNEAMPQNAAVVESMYLFFLASAKADPKKNKIAMIKYPVISITPPIPE